MSKRDEAKQFTGVSWHRRAKKFRAAFRFRDRDVNLGYFDSAQLAAWVSDFGRYLCFGITPSKWHFKTGRPNYPPQNHPTYPRVLVLSKLVSTNTLSSEELKTSLAAFDESCK